MTKNEKLALEAQKPLEERNYWHLSKSDKDIWLDKRGAKKSDDVIMPILYPCFSLLGVLLGLIFLILNQTSSGGVLHGTAMLVASIVVMLVCLGVGIFFFISMAKNKQGFFINQFYSGNTSSVKRTRDEIRNEQAVNDGLDQFDPSVSASQPTDEFEDLDSF